MVSGSLCLTSFIIVEFMLHVTAEVGDQLPATGIKPRLPDEPSDAIATPNVGGGNRTFPGIL